MLPAVSCVVHGKPNRSRRKENAGAIQHHALHDGFPRSGDVITQFGAAKQPGVGHVVEVRCSRLVDTGTVQTFCNIRVCQRRCRVA